MTSVLGLINFFFFFFAHPLIRLLTPNSCNISILLTQSYSPVAQSVEQVAVNHWVGGSSPSRGGNIYSVIRGSMHARDGTLIKSNLMEVSLQEALNKEHPLQIAGTINAYTALLAKRAGFAAIYLSGAGVANAAYGLPDLALTTINEVCEEVNRITDICDLPLLVDMDTGFGNALNIARGIKSLIKAGASAVHIEDQVQAKRCGHRPSKELVSASDMCGRLKAALDAKTNQRFSIMARTDALAIEGLPKTLERIQAYLEAGAEMIFLEGATALSQYQALAQVCQRPILANITEFGVTPLFTKEELGAAGVSLILYPLSAFRAMSQAAIDVYAAIRTEGSQAKLMTRMQSRDQLYEVLHYHTYEHQLDDLSAKGKTK
jgi:methylisocitrate lyase